MYSVQQELAAFDVASEHISWALGRGVSLIEIATLFGLPAPSSRWVLIAELARMWLALQDDLMEAA